MTVLRATFESLKESCRLDSKYTATLLEAVFGKAYKDRSIDVQIVEGVRGFTSADATGPQCIWEVGGLGLRAYVRTVESC
jgi:hypothetical protein